MGELFKGWRRKAGLVMLALAMLLMVGWMRSAVIQDLLRISHVDFESFNGCISWLRLDQGTFRHLVGWRSHPRDVAFSLREFDSSCWRVPYWSLVLPLTLLSAWLILGKTKGGGRFQLTSPPVPDFTDEEDEERAVLLAFA